MSCPEQDLCTTDYTNYTSRETRELRRRPSRGGYFDVELREVVSGCSNLTMVRPRVLRRRHVSRDGASESSLDGNNRSFFMLGGVGLRRSLYGVPLDSVEFNSSGGQFLVLRRRLVLASGGASFGEDVISVAAKAFFWDVSLTTVSGADDRRGFRRRVKEPMKAVERGTFGSDSFFDRPLCLISGEESQSSFGLC